jgi:hypothetical protein
MDKEKLLVDLVNFVREALVDECSDSFDNDDVKKMKSLTHIINRIDITMESMGYIKNNATRN